MNMEGDLSDANGRKLRQKMTAPSHAASPPWDGDGVTSRSEELLKQ